MAGRKSGYRFFAQSMEEETDGGFASDDWDESDVWGCSMEPRAAAAESIRNKPIPSSTRSNRKKSAADKGDRVTAAAAAAAAAASSLPMKIPDWSKILKSDYRGNNNNNNNSRILLELDEAEDEAEDVGSGMVIPPHELLWRNRAASFSVHEGIGRTLKGRDLSRVRNAIFEKTGFQD